jgi:hypothetical protein
MRAFQDYEFGWGGKTYVIPAARLLGLIAAVEEHLTIAELITNSTLRRMPLARIAQAYAVLLRAAGVTGAKGAMLITGDEVYTGMFKAGDSAIATAVTAIETAETAIIGLLGLMLPPEDVPPEPATPGKPVAASKRSSGSTKRSLARAG